jgi:hypothetical protein
VRPMTLQLNGRSSTAFVIVQISLWSHSNEIAPNNEEKAFTANYYLDTQDTVQL